MKYVLALIGMLVVHPGFAADFDKGVEAAQGELFGSTQSWGDVLQGARDG